MCALALAPTVSCRSRLLSVSSAAALTSVLSRRSSLVRPIVPAAEPNLVYNIKYYGAPPHQQGPSLPLCLHAGGKCLWLYTSVLPRARACSARVPVLPPHLLRLSAGQAGRVQQPVGIIISVTSSSGGSVSSK